MTNEENLLKLVFKEPGISGRSLCVELSMLYPDLKVLTRRLVREGRITCRKKGGSRHFFPVERKTIAATNGGRIKLPERLTKPKVVGRIKSYKVICMHPGVLLNDLFKLLQPLGVEQQDLPGILNPLADGEGAYIRIRREGGQFRLYSKDPKEPRQPGDVVLRYLG